MALTVHAIERFAQRVLKKDYRKDEKADIEKRFKEMMDESTLIWSGKYKENMGDADYYYHQDGYIFVTESNIAVTVYTLDYGFGEEIDRQIYETLAKQITKLQKTLDKLTGNNQRRMAEKEQEIGHADIQISELKNQLELLEKRRDKLTTDRNLLQIELTTKKGELDAVAMKLINSVQYRMELLAIKNNRKGA